MGRDGLDLSISLETILAQLPAGPGLLEAAKGSHRRENIVAVHPERNNICTKYLLYTLELFKSMLRKLKE